MSADAAARLHYVEAKLSYEIDVMAAEAAVAAGEAVLVDTRRRASWDHGHIEGSVHLQSEGAAALPRDRTLIVYGWGPGCNGATVTARELLAEGRDVRELLGGFEYWARNGLPIVCDGVPKRETPDPFATAER